MTFQSDITDHIEIFYLDRQNGWAVAPFDAERNQLEEAATAYHKTLATDYASAMAKRAGLPIWIFGQNGTLQRTIAGASTC